MKTKLFIIGLVLSFGISTSAMAQTSGATQGTSPAVQFSGDDALHPIADKQYTYSVTVDPTSSEVTWWTTKETSFLNADGTPNLTGEIHPGLSSTVQNSVQITWTTSMLNNTEYNVDPTFVAMMAKDCSNNLKVYQIDPLNGFTVDALPLGENYGTVPAFCVDEVASAKWTTGGMLYDYGVDTLKYEVVAANFTKEYTPSFRIDGLQGDETATLKWSYSQDVENNAEETITLTEGAVQTATKNAVTDESTSEGVSIYVSIIIEHNTYEGLTDSPISFFVSGTDMVGNLDQNLSADNTTWVDAQYADETNTVEYTLTKRPTITDGTGSGTDFE